MKTTLLTVTATVLVRAAAVLAHPSRKLSVLAYAKASN